MTETTQERERPETLMTVVCDSLRTLLSEQKGDLGRIRVGYGDASIEIEWPSRAPAAGPTVLPVPYPAHPIAGSPTAPATPGVPAAPEARADTATPIAPQTPPEVPEADRHYVRAPMVGTFYHAPEPGARPFIEVGDHVDAGEQVGILEAMKLMNAIESDMAGEVIEVIVPDGAPVEFGEALLEIRVDE